MPMMMLMMMMGGIMEGKGDAVDANLPRHDLEAPIEPELVLVFWARTN